MTPITRQILFVSSVCCNAVSLGLVYGFPAVLIPHLKDSHGDLTADLDTISWFVAIPGLFALLMNILVGPLMDTCGRKRTNLLITCSGLIGWIISASSYSITPLLVARALHGILKGAGHFYLLCVGEYTAPEMRGVVVTIFRVFLTSATAAGHSIGIFIHWRYVTYIRAGISLLGLLFNLLWTESPEWLIVKQRYEEAEDTFYKLREKTPDSETEINNMIAKRQAQSKRNKRNVLQSLRYKPFWRVAAIGLSKQVLIECGGHHYFPSFLIEFVTDVIGDNSVFIYVTALDLISVLASIASSILVKRYSRRGILLNTGWASVVFMLSFSLALFLFDMYPSVGYLRTVALVFFILYYMTVHGATFPVDTVLGSELWPLNIRQVGIVYQSLVSSAVFTIWMRLVPYLKLYLRVYGMFTLCSVLISVCLLHLYKCLPETKDKTLHDIGEYFQRDDVTARTRSRQYDKDIERRLLERNDVMKTTNMIVKQI